MLSRSDSVISRSQLAQVLGQMRWNALRLPAFTHVQQFRATDQRNFWLARRTCRYSMGAYS